MNPRYNTMESAAGLLRKAGVLQPLMQKAHSLARLDQRVGALLPASIKGHCRVANMRDTALVLLVDSAAWATRLRYLAPDLCRQLQAGELPHLTRVEVRISPPQTQAQPKSPARRLRLHAEAAAAIADAAQAIEDPLLKAALRRLSRHGA